MGSKFFFYLRVNMPVRRYWSPREDGGCREKEYQSVMPSDRPTDHTRSVSWSDSIRPSERVEQAL